MAAREFILALRLSDAERKIIAAAAPKDLSPYIRDAALDQARRDLQKTKARS